MYLLCFDTLGVLLDTFHIQVILEAHCIFVLLL